MNQRLRYSIKYIKYQLFAKHKKGHGVHSPFMFNLITQVFNNKIPDKDLKKVFLEYDKFKRCNRVLSLAEIGAGTSYNKKNQLTVKKIVCRSSINKKYGQLLYNLVKYFNPTQVLELGTSVGVSTAFISQAATNATFRTIEGIAQKIEIAKKMAVELQTTPEFIEGNFDTILDTVLDKFQHIDFVFFDGNHTRQATTDYFNRCVAKIQNDSIFVFDDIHWSEEMEEAWEDIKSHKKVTVSIDLFRLGLIFFKKELSKQHYVIKF